MCCTCNCCYRATTRVKTQSVQTTKKCPKAFDQHVSPLSNALAESQGIVHLQPFFFRFTLATTPSLIFGDGVSGLKQGDHDAFASALDYASGVSAIRLRLADFSWLWQPMRFSKACQTMRSYASNIVGAALRDPATCRNHAEAKSESLILALYQELHDPALVPDELVNVLMARRDTTAWLLSWKLWVIGCF